MNPPSTTRIVFLDNHEEGDIDTDGILVENNFLTSTADDSVYGGEGSLRRRQFLRTPIQDNDPWRYLLRCLIALSLIMCILYVIVDFSGDRKIESILIAFLEWTHLHPYRGIIAVILCYIVATVFFVPGSILTFGAGFAIGSAFDNTFLGVLIATASVFIGASIGSICSFLLGRYLFRDCVLQLAFSYPIFQAIERALETNGLKIMILLRLSPLIPFNALDYISGITSISLRDYAIALVAILPGAVVLCFAGASASSLTDTTSSASNNTVKMITIVSGILFGGGGFYLASYYSKNELDRILAAQSESDTTDYIIRGLPEDEADEIFIETDREGDDDEIEGFSTELVESTSPTMDR